jgi:hypothetical protein
MTSGWWRSAGFWLGVLLFLGCSRQEEIVLVDIADAAPPDRDREAIIGLKVDILTFSDLRHDRSILGAKIGRWGALDSFNFGVRGEAVGVVTSLALKSYLRGRGCRVSIIENRGQRENGVLDPPDVTLSGEIVELSLNARSWLLSTDIKSSVKIIVEAANRIDGSTSRTTLAQDGLTTVYWFEPKVAQVLVNEVLNESFAQLRLKPASSGNTCL